MRGSIKRQAALGLVRSAGRITQRLFGRATLEVVLRERLERRFVPRREGGGQLQVTRLHLARAQARRDDARDALVAAAERLSPAVIDDLQQERCAQLGDAGAR